MEGAWKMKLLIRQWSSWVAMLAVLGAVHCVDAQLIDLFGGQQGDYTTNYLFTISNVGGDFLAVDPTTDARFGLTGWTERDYITALPVSGATVVDTGATHSLSWQSNTGSGAFGYGGSSWPAGINGFVTNNIQNPVDLLAPLGISESDVDGQKYTQYFRINFSNTTPITTMGFDALADDGAVFYVDGVEIARLNCCNSGLLRNTPDAPIGVPPEFISATSHNNPGDESNYRRIFADLSGLGGSIANGSHVFSMSVHAYPIGVGWTSNDMGIHVRRAFLSTEDNQWNNTGSGNWEEADPADPQNWVLFEPGEPGQTANLWGKITRSSTVYHNGGTLVLGELNFDSSNTYAVAGTSTLVFNSGGSNSRLVVQRGAHDIQLTTSLENDLDVDVATGATIEFNNTLDMQNFTLNQIGPGTVGINNLVLNQAPLAASAGTLGGTGVIAGDLLNDGAAVAPGASPGTLTVLGDYTQHPDGSLEIEIAGTTASSEHDVLVVAGTANLAGELNVILMEDMNGNPYMPSAGDKFEILRLGHVNGSFDSIVLPNLDTGLAWDMSDLYSLGTLAVVPEPGSLAMLLMGGILLAARRRLSSNSHQCVSPRRLK